MLKIFSCNVFDSLVHTLYKQYQSHSQSTLFASYTSKLFHQHKGALLVLLPFTSMRVTLYIQAKEGSKGLRYFGRKVRDDPYRIGVRMRTIPSSWDKPPRGSSSRRFSKSSHFYFLTVLTLLVHEHVAPMLFIIKKQVSPMHFVSRKEMSGQFDALCQEGGCLKQVNFQGINYANWLFLRPFFKK